MIKLSKNLSWSKTIIRFLIAGLLNTLLTLLIYWVMLRKFSPLTSYSVSFVIGIIFSFMLNSLGVFKTPLKWKIFYYFLVGYFFQYFIGYTTLYFLFTKLSYNRYYSIIGVLIITVPTNFICNKFIFTKNL